MKISQSWILAYDRVLDDTPTLASGSFIKNAGSSFFAAESFLY